MSIAGVGAFNWSYDTLQLSQYGAKAKAQQGFTLEADTVAPAISAPLGRWGGVSLRHHALAQVRRVDSRLRYEVGRPQNVLGPISPTGCFVVSTWITVSPRVQPLTFCSGEKGSMCILLIFIAAMTALKANSWRIKAAVDERLMKGFPGSLFSKSPLRFPFSRAMQVICHEDQIHPIPSG
ncbi:MAG: hypothetical protein LAQ69_34075 [Acidobacteriia bacterium]|nr:hypothetical protein [Terriglobia bacterium]